MRLAEELLQGERKWREVQADKQAKREEQQAERDRQWREEDIRLLKADMKIKALAPTAATIVGVILSLIVSTIVSVGFGLLIKGTAAPVPSHVNADRAQINRQGSIIDNGTPCRYSLNRGIFRANCTTIARATSTGLPRARRSARACTSMAPLRLSFTNREWPANTFGTPFVRSRFSSKHGATCRMLRICPSACLSRSLGLAFLVRFGHSVFSSPSQEHLVVVLPFPGRRIGGDDEQDNRNVVQVTCLKRCQVDVDMEC